MEAMDVEEPEPEILPEADEAENALESNVVASGDPSAAAMSKKNTVTKLAEKKVATDKRTCTPYMTKYERARVLGTRAQQIRCAES